jgi:hypothetical protein
MIPDNWFREHSPAQIIAKVGEITLTVISEWSEEELARVGWSNNPVIDILYSLTSAGVWIARTTASGEAITFDNSTYSQATVARYAVQGFRPCISGLASSSAVQIQRTPVVGIVNFTSNAGGSIDSDPELVPALAGYYGVIEKLIVIGPNETPIFEIQGGSTAIGVNVSPGTLDAQVPTEMDVFRYSSNDNEAISLDGSGCSALGNAQTYEIQVVYHYET